MSESTKAGEIVEIQLNGKKKNIAKGMTIEGLIDELKINRRNCFVEKNKIPLKPEEYAVSIEAGDSIELARFIGGG